MRDSLDKLNKTELLSIIYEQQVEIEKLKSDIKKLEKDLNSKSIAIKDAGSIAEASLKLNEIFEKAQEAADQYLENVKLLTKDEDIKTINIESNKKVNHKNKIVEKKFNNIIPKNLALVPVNLGLSITKAKLKQVIVNCLATLFSKIKKLITAFKTLSISLIKRLCIVIIIFFNFFKNKLKKIYNSIKNFSGKKQKNKENNSIKTNKNVGKKIINKNSKISIEKRKLHLSSDDLKKVLETRKNRSNKIIFFRNFVFACLVVISMAIITATSFFKILQVNGSSMEPNLRNGELLITSSFFKYKRGDIIAFFYNDKVLIKRIIAIEGDTVNMDDDGTVYVNNEKLNEDYVNELNYGKCNITFPFVVPQDTVFILGDNRRTSLDSRSTSIGCIKEDNIVGKIKFRLYPVTIY